MYFYLISTHPLDRLLLVNSTFDKPKQRNLSLPNTSASTSGPTNFDGASGDIEGQKESTVIVESTVVVSSSENVSQDLTTQSAVPSTGSAPSASSSSSGAQYSADFDDAEYAADFESSDSAVVNSSSSTAASEGPSAKSLITAAFEVDIKSTAPSSSFASHVASTTPAPFATESNPTPTIASDTTAVISTTAVTASVVAPVRRSSSAKQSTAVDTKEESKDVQGKRLVTSVTFVDSVESTFRRPRENGGSSSRSSSRSSSLSKLRQERSQPRPASSNDYCRVHREEKSQLVQEERYTDHVHDASLPSSAVVLHSEASPARQRGAKGTKGPYSDDEYNDDARYGGYVRPLRPLSRENLSSAVVVHTGDQSKVLPLPEQVRNGVGAHHRHFVAFLLSVQHIHIYTTPAIYAAALLLVSGGNPKVSKNYARSDIEGDGKRTCGAARVRL